MTKLTTTNLLYTLNLNLLYPVILFLLAILPINGSSSALNNNYLLHIRWDYLVHALVYVPLFPLMMLGGGKSISKYKVLALAMAIAITFEALQYLIPWRTFNVNDLLANVLGVGVGVTVWILIRRKITISLNKTN